jgi:hypothetical protein
MAKIDCWALEIKTRKGGYVKLSPWALPESPFRTMLFKSRKAALDWAQADPYWHDKAKVEKITVTTKGFME